MATEEPPAAPSSLPKYLRKGLPKQNRETLLEIREYIDELLEWTQQPIDDDELPDDADPVDGGEDGSSPKGGTVVMEKVTCGDETCKCMKKGEKHGPYKYVYYRTADGTLTSDYIDNE
jgi:hypothetical protein